MARWRPCAVAGLVEAQRLMQPRYEDTAVGIWRLFCELHGAPTVNVHDVPR